MTTNDTKCKKMKIWVIHIQSKKYPGEHTNMLIHARNIQQAISQALKHNSLVGTVEVESATYMGFTNN